MVTIILKNIRDSSPAQFKFVRVPQRSLAMEEDDDDDDDCWYDQSYRDRLRLALFLVLRALSQKMPLALFIDIVDRKRYDEYRFHISPEHDDCKKYIVQLLKLKHVLHHFDVCVLDVFVFDYELHTKSHFDACDLSEFVQTEYYWCDMHNSDICKCAIEGDQQLDQMNRELTAKIKATKERNRDIDGSICDICISNAKNTLLPCLHVLCSQCTSQLPDRKCPFCKRQFSESFVLKQPVRRQPTENPLMINLSELNFQ